MISSDTLKEDLKRFVKTKEKQTDVKQKQLKLEPEPFNPYEEQYYEANVTNFRIDNRFDKPNVQYGSKPVKYGRAINYPNIDKDRKEWKSNCC